METNTVVTGFVKDQLLRGNDQLLPDPSGSLVDAGVLDSISVLKLVLFIEERFGIEIADEEVTPHNLASIDRITAFIERKKDKPI
ncbi:MAG TPA: acyl carrier protein [Nitrospiraceae bacterium]|nr:acyl carrier protein [Nitrospiraceae bacterium]